MPKLLRQTASANFLPTYLDHVGSKGKLYTTGDIADRLGVTRQYALVLTKDRTKGFPDSFDDLASGSVWLVPDVERWIKTSWTPRSEDPEA
jgi:hypothetical protein